MAGNPKAVQLLARLLASGGIQKNTQARAIYEDPRYNKTFGVVKFEKFRKRFKDERDLYFENAQNERTFAF